MTEDQKPTFQSEEAEDPARIEGALEGPEHEEAAPAPDMDRHKENHLAEKRGRMVSAGILSALVLSVLVVVVAVIFQIGSRFVLKCPQDLSVNDPAPVLWEKIEVSRLGQQPVGVPENFLPQVGLKMGNPAEETEK